MWVILAFFDNNKNKKPRKVSACGAYEQFVFLISDPAGTRTQGPYIKSVLLYQLSYGIILCF